MNWLFGGKLLSACAHSKNFQSITALAPLFYSQWLVVVEIQWLSRCGQCGALCVATWFMPCGKWPKTMM